MFTIRLSTDVGIHLRKTESSKHIGIITCHFDGKPINNLRFYKCSLTLEMATPATLTPDQTATEESPCSPMIHPWTEEGAMFSLLIIFNYELVYTLHLFIFVVEYLLRRYNFLKEHFQIGRLKDVPIMFVRTFSRLDDQRIVYSHSLPRKDEYEKCTSERRNLNRAESRLVPDPMTLFWGRPDSFHVT